MGAAVSTSQRAPRTRDPPAVGGAGGLSRNQPCPHPVVLPEPGQREPLVSWSPQDSNTALAQGSRVWTQGVFIFSLLFCIFPHFTE